MTAARVALGVAVVLVSGSLALSQPAVGTPAVPATPAGQPSVKDAPPKLYDESADAKQQIAAAVAKAKKENRRVLVQWGGNWCGWCIQLDKLCKKDQAIAKELLYEYDVVRVDAGKDNKNMELGVSYGAELAKHGFPFLTILDADGKAIANQETSSLENKDQEKSPGHDPKLVLDFLKKHEATPKDGQQILDAGLATARSEGKVVFLHFGAPWCVYCHKMERWMAQPEVKAILAKQFVDVKIDAERNTGGQALLTKYCGAEKMGIPWFVLLDENNKPLADSMNGEKGNVGFPVADDEIAHFETMLKKAAPKFTETDLGWLTASLKAFREKGKAK
ncbi:MAG: thioredoxin family protein [Pyrinomonadaceae bacterium]|nr:thioredoxin family protein [Phycisphaerales bacterium]